MTIGNILAWIIVGVIVGFLFVYVRKQQNGGVVLLDVVVGIVGGFLGGAILFTIGGMVGVEIIGVNLAGLVVALIGAIALDAMLQLMLPSREQ